MTPSLPSLLARVFLPFAAGYFLSYLYRTINAVIAPDLTADLALDPAGLGLLTSAYFLAFAAAQLPLGVLLDRYGPRRVEALLLVIAAAGALIFATAASPAPLIAGRAMIGFGVSACLMAAFKANVLWFPRERLALVNGTTLAFGGLGAITATAPVAAALQVTDWRGVFLGLAVLTLAVAALLAVVVPERHRDGPPAGTPWKGLGRIYGSRAFWTIAPVTIASQATFLGVQSLWAGPWLRDVQGLDRAGAAELLLLIATAMVAGFLGMGFITERLTRRGVRPLSVAAGGMALFMTAQLGLLLRIEGLSPLLWMLFGFAGTTGALSYAILTQSFPPDLAGRVNTALNLVSFVGAFAVQAGFGAVVGLWPSQDGAYPPAAYQTALGCLLALQVMGMGWLLLNFRRPLEARTEEPG